MITFRGAAARWGHPAGLGAIGRFWRKNKQFQRLVTFENAAARWRLAHCKKKSPRRRRCVNSHRGAVGVLPRDGASAIARQCDGSSATTKMPGGGTTAIAQ